MNKINLLADKIRSIANDYCESQMYCWPGFDPMDPDPGAFFHKLGIEFDGDLFIRYPVKNTFSPMTHEAILEEEDKVGLLLPMDYKLLLAEFGSVQLPGAANIAIMSPIEAMKSTRSMFCSDGKPLIALAISSYNQEADGKSIGFIRDGSEFSSIIYQFDHELAYKGDEPSLWSKPLAESLSEFLLGYLETIGRRR
jgi:hypothetical protein